MLIEGKNNFDLLSFPLFIVVIDRNSVRFRLYLKFRLPPEFCFKMLPKIDLVSYIYYIYIFGSILNRNPSPPCLLHRFHQMNAFLNEIFFCLHSKLITNLLKSCSVHFANTKSLHIER